MKKCDFCSKEAVKVTERGVNLCRRHIGKSLPGFRPLSQEERIQFLELLVDELMIKVYGNGYNAEKCLARMHFEKQRVKNVR